MAVRMANYIRKRNLDVETFNWSQWEKEDWSRWPPSEVPYWNNVFITWSGEQIDTRSPCLTYLVNYLQQRATLNYWPATMIPHRWKSISTSCSHDSQLDLKTISVWLWNDQSLLLTAARADQRESCYMEAQRVLPNEGAAGYLNQKSISSYSAMPLRGIGQLFDFLDLDVETHKREGLLREYSFWPRW